jgi:diguanylate cyclase (GGDEF)-like protein
MNKNRNFWPILGLILLIITLTAVAMIDDDNQLIINTDDVTDMNQNWTWIKESEVIPLDTLPTTLEVVQDEPYTISQELSEDFFFPQVLLVRASLATLIVRLDDEIIYEHIHEENPRTLQASLWHLIEVPASSDGKTISLTFETSYQNIAGTLNPVMYGNHSAIYEYLISSYGYRLLIGLFVFFAGLIMMFGSSFTHLGLQKRDGLVGLFAVLLSLWLIAESRMLQFVTGSHILIASMAYLALASFPLPLLVFIHRSIDKIYQKWIRVLIVLFSVQLLLVIIFQISGIADFYESVIYTQILIGIGIATTIFTLGMIYVKTKDDFAKRFLSIIGFLSVFFLAEIINFIWGNLENVSVYLSFGIFLLSIYLLVLLYRNVMKRMKEGLEKEFYQRLAYVDQLTKAKNRTAFEADIDKVFANLQELSKVSIVYIDIDNLKEINDELGHLQGDRYLVEAYKMISQHYMPYGECYRVGGDEFACIVKNMNQNLLDAIRYHIQSAHTIADLGQEIKISLSIGYSSFITQDEKPSDLIKRADEAMYQDKKLKKSMMKNLEK